MSAQPVTLPADTVAIHIRPPHEKQALFIKSKAKRKIIRAGRRGGKTTGIAILAIKKFLEGYRVLYAAPTTDQLAAFWREIKKALGDAIEAGVYRKNETEHIIEIDDSTEHTVVGLDVEPDALRQRIRAKTAWNADTLRGDYADVLILDEFQLMNEDAWETVGAPMLLDNNGDAVFIYTPPSLKSSVTSKATDLRHAAKMFKRAQKDTTGRWEAFHFRSQDNPHISEEALLEIIQDMTALAYKQEIEAEDVDEVPGALWTRALIEQTRVRKEDMPELQRVVTGVDPSGSSTTEAGIVTSGKGIVDRTDHVYIFADDSLLAPSPKTWASKAILAYDTHRADRIVGERNYGGDMVEETVRHVDESVSYKDVVATRGKLVRAEPIAALFEKGVAHIVGHMPQLEDEMCSYVPGNPSPNRLDAMVWTVTELTRGGMLGLIDWMKSGQAQTLLDTQKQQPVVVSGSGVVAAQRTDERCPQCKCTCVIRISGDQKRCQECGHQFGEAKTMFRNISRTDYKNEFAVGRHR